jgi:hypothetical protein
LNDETGASLFEVSDKTGNDIAYVLGENRFVGAKNEGRILGSSGSKVYVGSIDRNSDTEIRGTSIRLGTDTTVGGKLDVRGRAEARNGYFVEGEHPRVNGSFYVRAVSSPTKPLFNISNNSDDALHTFDSTDLTNHVHGGGVVLTSPDGSTKKRVRLDNNGDLVTETV